jgi:hypothetical protein
VGFYYEQSEPTPEEKPPGCLETLLITRAVFAVIVPVVLALMLLLADVALVFILFGEHPALALIPIAVTVVGVWLYARWEQRRFRPPGL